MDHTLVMKNSLQLLVIIVLTTGVLSELSNDFHEPNPADTTPSLLRIANLKPSKLKDIKLEESRRPPIPQPTQSNIPNKELEVDKGRSVDPKVSRTSNFQSNNYHPILNPTGSDDGLDFEDIDLNRIEYSLRNPDKPIREKAQSVSPGTVNSVHETVLGSIEVQDSTPKDQVDESPTKESLAIEPTGVADVAINEATETVTQTVNLPQTPNEHFQPPTNSNPTNKLVVADIGKVNMAQPNNPAKDVTNSSSAQQSERLDGTSPPTVITPVSAIPVDPKPFEIDRSSNNSETSQSTISPQTPFEQDPLEGSERPKSGEQIGIINIADSLGEQKTRQEQVPSAIDIKSADTRSDMARKMDAVIKLLEAPRSNNLTTQASPQNPETKSIEPVVGLLNLASDEPAIRSKPDPITIQTLSINNFEQSTPRPPTTSGPLRMESSTSPRPEQPVATEVTSKPQPAAMPAVPAEAPVDMNPQPLKTDELQRNNSIKTKEVLATEAPAIEVKTQVISDKPVNVTLTVEPPTKNDTRPAQVEEMQNQPDSGLTLPNAELTTTAAVIEETDSGQETTNRESSTLSDIKDFRSHSRITESERNDAHVPKSQPVSSTEMPQLEANITVMNDPADNSQDDKSSVSIIEGDRESSNHELDKDGRRTTVSPNIPESIQPQAGQASNQPENVQTTAPSIHEQKVEDVTRSIIESEQLDSAIVNTQTTITPAIEPDAPNDSSIINGVNQFGHQLSSPKERIEEDRVRGREPYQRTHRVFNNFRRQSRIPEGQRSESTSYVPEFTTHRAKLYQPSERNQVLGDEKHDSNITPASTTSIANSSDEAGMEADVTSSVTTTIEPRLSVNVESQIESQQQIGPSIFSKIDIMEILIISVITLFITFSSIIFQKNQSSKLIGQKRQPTPIEPKPADEALEAKRKEWLNLRRDLKLRDDHEKLDVIKQELIWRTKSMDRRLKLNDIKQTEELSQDLRRLAELIVECKKTKDEYSGSEYNVMLLIKNFIEPELMSELMRIVKHQKMYNSYKDHEFELNTECELLRDLDRELKDQLKNVDKETEELNRTIKLAKDQESRQEQRFKEIKKLLRMNDNLIKELENKVTNKHHATEEIYEQYLRLFKMTDRLIKCSQ